MHDVRWEEWIVCGEFEHLSHPSKSHLDVVSVKVVGASKSSFLLQTATYYVHSGEKLETSTNTVEKSHL